MNELRAFVDGHLIGTFASQNGQLSFHYTDTVGCFPISLSMPLGRDSYGKRQASAYLWGLLPDNQVAIENMAKEAGASASSVFGILAVHGRDVAGALQLLPPGETPSDNTQISVDDQSELLDDEQLEQLLRTTMSRYSGRAPQGGDAFKFSVAGAQPKIALTANRQGHFLVPTTDIATTHILKPNFVDSEYFISEVEAVELISLRAAALLGLETAEVTLWESPSGDLKSLVVKRYDRAFTEGGYVRRIHQEDFCQALAVMPEKKYQHQFGGPGVGAIAQLFRTALPREERKTSAEKFFSALVFNVGIVGTDAHAKNYSILLDENIRLAPLYDVISAAAHLDSEQAAYFPMKIGETYAIDQITIKGLVSAGRKLGLSAAGAEQITENILSRIPSALALAATDVGRPDLADKLIDGIQRKSPVRWLN
ncbi:HipA domain-containing protein [Staphylococcus chromogenes]|nr:HipA domain-containing protein [Staphylococcus chromogenes]